MLLVRWAGLTGWCATVATPVEKGCFVASDKTLFIHEDKQGDRPATHHEPAWGGGSMGCGPDPQPR